MPTVRFFYKAVLAKPLLIYVVVFVVARAFYVRVSVCNLLQLAAGATLLQPLRPTSFLGFIWRGPSPVMFLLQAPRADMIFPSLFRADMIFHGFVVCFLYVFSCFWKWSVCDSSMFFLCFSCVSVFGLIMFFTCFYCKINMFFRMRGKLTCSTKSTS